MTGDDASSEHHRLGILTATTDGFRIAEEDLRLRGPGEMLGTRQHGLPQLRVADLLQDGDLLRMAQRDAGDLLREDSQLRREEHRLLRTMLMAKYKAGLAFIDAG
jgi:ATP-dependent DNA helicase RecG